MPLPAITPEQRQAALAKAAGVRRARTEALAPVKDRSTRISDVLAAAFADEDHPLHGARVRQVLLAVPGIGKVKAEGIMTSAGITAKRRVGGLGSRQREALTTALSSF